jgi:hypothetical protein
MKRGTKIFIFVTAMIMTVGVLKVTTGHRYNNIHKGDCCRFNLHEAIKPHTEKITTPYN